MAAAAFNATATQKSAYDTIVGHKVTTIRSVDYSLDDFQEFEQGILRAATKVPTELAGGECGHAYLVLDQEVLQKFTGDYTLTQSAVTNPGTDPGILGNDSNATIHLKTAQQAVLLTEYHTQEGTLSGLRDLIIANVPKATISELKDKRFGFERRTPLELLGHLKDGAEPTDILSLNEMLDARDAAIDFEGEESLKEFFKAINEMIKRLDDDHGIDTSYSTLTAKYLLQIEQHGGNIFRAHLGEWRAKDKNQRTWKEFQKHWIKADKERRRDLKLSIDSDGGRGTTKHSANMVEEQKMELRTMFAAGMADLADATQESVNAAVEKRYHADAARGDRTKDERDKKDDTTTAEVSALKKHIAALQKQLEEQKGGGGGSGKGGGGKGGDGTRFAKCKHCGKHHPTPEADCWHVKKNRDKAPAWFKERFPEK